MEAAFSILLPALIAGLLVLSTHVPLGRVVLARGIIFIDIAIAQIAGMGVVAAGTLGLDPGGWAGQVAAGFSALAAAALFNLCEKLWPDVLEALIGIAFVLASSGSILLLAGDPHAGEQLKDLLVGQILWVGGDQLIYTGILYALILLAWFGYRQKIGNTGFYLLFAMAITASVQMVGVYLVFASLIIPAIASKSMVPARQLLGAYMTGFAGYVAGLMLSFIYDFPSGAIIVWSMAGIALGVSIFCRWNHVGEHEIGG